MPLSIHISIIRRIFLFILSRISIQIETSTSSFHYQDSLRHKRFHPPFSLILRLELPNCIQNFFKTEFLRSNIGELCVYRVNPRRKDRGCRGAPWSTIWREEGTSGRASRPRSTISRDCAARTTATTTPPTPVNPPRSDTTITDAPRPRCKRRRPFG